jgi:hypothetical protein
MAKLLTPFVQAVYDGKEYTPRLKIEGLNDVGYSDKTTPARLLELFEEDLGDGDTNTGAVYV